VLSLSLYKETCYVQIIAVRDTMRQPPLNARTHKHAYRVHATNTTTTLVAKAPVWSGCRLERVTRNVPGVTYSSPSTTSNT
jgi:ABC-type arginine transport system permease subunit